MRTFVRLGSIATEKSRSLTPLAKGASGFGMTGGAAGDETSAWGDEKILHHFEPGRKNLTVVSGIGSEAYLQVMPDRSDFEGTIWVHKNLSHFRLIAVSEQSPSPDVLKAAAQKIAAKLP